MAPELLLVVFWLLVATVVLLAYEMHESLKPTYCEHCAHCAAVREAEAEARTSAVRETWKRPEGRPPFSWRDRDDDTPHDGD